MCIKQCVQRLIKPLLLALFLPLSWTAKTFEFDPSKEYKEGEVIVRWREDTSKSTIAKFLSAHDLHIKRQFTLLTEKYKSPWMVLTSTNLSTKALIQLLKTNPAVITVEPNYLRKITEIQIRPPLEAFFSNQWALNNSGQVINGVTGTPGADIKFLAAWGLTRESTNTVIIGVIDTGVDRTHPDLISNIWQNPLEIPFNGVDDDGNGYVDDIWGYDFATGSWDSSDSGDHGTHVTGIIAATADNGIGISGACYKTKILPLKASSDGIYLEDAAIIAAIEYAVSLRQRGFNVVALNASYSGSYSNEAEFVVIQLAGQAGIILCTAAGNEGENIDNIPVYPACYKLENIITVSATDQEDQFPTFANYGTNSVHLAAPGYSILSTIPLKYGLVNCRVVTTNNVFEGEHFEYAGVTPGVTGIIYHCRLGYPTDFPREVSNNIALIQRGEIYFSTKIANAMAAGAKAAIIYNNTSGSISGTLQYNSNWIPVIGITMEAGLLLSNMCPIPGVVVAWPDETSVYDYKTGSSMATPLVAAAVGLAALNFPDEPLDQRVKRILSAIDPLESLRERVATAGRLNLAKIVDTDYNGLPDWWEQFYFKCVGISPEVDPDQDGATNLAEWVAGTNPTNKHSRFQIGYMIEGATNLTLTWPTAPRRAYQILVNTNYPTSGFSQVGSNIVGSGNVNLSIHQNKPVVLYQVKIVPEFEP